MIATTLETIRDLGVPTIVGTIIGALIAHFTARARGREEHERTVDLLVTQDERRTAQGMLDAVREIRNRLNVASAPIAYGELHNDWADRVLAPARVIRSDALACRARAGAYVIFLATLAPAEHATYAVLRAALAVEEWLESWLRRDTPPPAHLPSMDEIRSLVWSQKRRPVSLEPLNELLEERA